MRSFKTGLGFELLDITIKKEESVTAKIMKTFPNEKNITTTFCFKISK